MEGFLFSLCIPSLCLSLFLFILLIFVCQIGHPVVKMDVIGIDMPWNAKVPLGFSQLSSPEGSESPLFIRCRKGREGGGPFSLKANE